MRSEMKCSDVIFSLLDQQSLLLASVEVVLWLVAWMSSKIIYSQGDVQVN